MTKFFSLVALVFSAAAKSIETFTTEITKDGKALNLFVETVKEVIPAMEESGVKQAAKKLTDAGDILDKTLSRMKQDMKWEFSEKLPKSSDFFAIDDRTRGAAKDAIAWILKAEYAESRGETLEELEEELAQDVKYLLDDVKYGRQDIERLADSDEPEDKATVAKLEKRIEKATDQLRRRFGIV